MKVLSQQNAFIGIGVTQTHVDNATVVRLFNSAATTKTVNVLDYVYPYGAKDYHVIGSISIHAEQVIYIQKKSEQYLAGDSEIYYSKIAYSPVMEYASWLEGGGSGPGGGGSIVTNGLIMHMDPGDTNSYSGSGTTWYDLTSNNNDWTLIGTVSHGNDSVATSTKVFSMSKGSNSNPNYIEMDNDISTVMHGTSDSDYTVMVASRYSSTTNQDATFGNTDNSPQVVLGHWNGYTGVALQHSGWIGNPGGYGSIGETDWAIYTMTRDQSEDHSDLWVNGTKYVNDSTSGSAGPKKLRAGGASSNHLSSTCCIGVILVHDRVLTDSEIEQNYDALKTRYGLS
tara:strand:+ start:4015 stop:5034 length:1020 start_codon:yes stop_codon:yes gene_type:complete